MTSCIAIAALLPLLSAGTAADPAPVETPAIRSSFADPAQEDDGNLFDVSWDDGLKLETRDGAVALQIGGRLMADWTWATGDEYEALTGATLDDGVEFRRARLSLSGDLPGNLYFKTEYDFANPSDGDATVAFKDVYLGIKDVAGGGGRLQVGHFKEPFSLEELTSANYITFLERGLPNVFVPVRNQGVMYRNTISEDQIQYGIGVFRGDTDDAGFDQQEGGYAVTGRISGVPVHGDGGRKLVHVGGSYTTRDQEGARFRQRPENHLVGRPIDTGTIVGSDDVDVWGVEAAGVFGPLSLQGEYVMAAVSGDGDEPDLSGAYLFGSYFLTGEHRAYKKSDGAFSKLQVEEPFGQGNGAWEVALRYSFLDFDESESAIEELTDVTLGLNWYLSNTTRIMFNYINSTADTGDDDESADIFAVRFHTFF